MIEDLGLSMDVARIILQREGRQKSRRPVASAKKGAERREVWGGDMGVSPSPAD